MNKIRITAIRQTVYQDLIDQYENPIEHACDIQKGQQWISVSGKCPEGLCSSAWESMRPFVQSLARGKGNFFDGWMRNPMSAMISCNDGFRPFSFYIEAIEDEKPETTETAKAGEATRQPKPRPVPKDKEEARVYKLVQALGEKTLPRRQLIADVGLTQKSRCIFTYNYMKPALHSGLVAFAYQKVPSKPEQAYRLTAKGRSLYAQLTGETE